MAVRKILSDGGSNIIFPIIFKLLEDYQVGKRTEILDRKARYEEEKM